MATKTKKTSGTKTISPLKVFLGVLGLGALGGAGYFAITALSKPKTDSSPAGESGGGPGPGSGGGTPTGLPAGSFPISSGQKNQLIQKLQSAIANGTNSEAANIIKTTSRKSDGTFDGIWGNGLSNALKVIGYSVSSLSQSQYDAIGRMMSTLKGLGCPGMVSHDVKMKTPGTVVHLDKKKSCDLAPGTIVGQVVSEGGGYLKVLTIDNDLVAVQKSDVEPA